ERHDHAGPPIPHPLLGWRRLDGHRAELTRGSPKVRALVCGRPRGERSLRCHVGPTLRTEPILLADKVATCTQPGSRLAAGRAEALPLGYRMSIPAMKHQTRPVLSRDPQLGFPDTRVTVRTKVD